MQPEYELRLHPVDLSQFGMNPYGKPLYRVVWADTRKSVVFCKGKKHVLPRYMHGEEGSAAGKWVLEKWGDAQKIVNMTREQWDAFLAAFPEAAAEEYPEKGEYELSYVFPDLVDEVFLHKQLAMHEFRLTSMTKNDRLVELEQAEDLKEKIEEEVFDEQFDKAREEILCQH